MDAEFWKNCAEEWQKLWEKSSDNFARLNELCNGWRKDYKKSKIAGEALANAAEKWLDVDERMRRSDCPDEYYDEWDSAKFALDDAVKAWWNR